MSIFHAGAPACQIVSMKALNLKWRFLPRTPWTNLLILVCAMGFSVVLLTPRTHSVSGSFAEVVTKDHNSNLSQIALSEPTWYCRNFDQLSYCVYFHSLCLDVDAQLVLVTEDESKHGQSVKVLNELSPAPWHAPKSDELSISALGRYDVPFRSFFNTAKYSKPLVTEGARLIKGWSLVAAFDADNYNIYHFMNKMHASFVARMYEIAGLKDRSVSAAICDTADDLLQELLSPRSEFDRAYLFRPTPTSWQQNVADLCLGNKTSVSYSPAENLTPICFEKAIIPGAALYLTDGLASSVIFRELAAIVKHIRVPEGERNVITIFDRSMGNRLILNLRELTEAVQAAAPGMQVIVVDWDGDVDFKKQATHMARTRIMISTHGSVLNHNIFMEMASVVIEINAYQFTYPVDNQVAYGRGNFYIRYEESLQNTRHQGLQLGEDPFPELSTRACMRHTDCLLARRDADINVNVSMFMIHFLQALSLVT